MNLSSLIDDAKCYALVRQQRWPDGVRCPGCDSAAVIRHGRDDTQPHRQRYRCKACAGRFDDLTGTVLAGHHQPLRVWVLCLYLMGLNLSNRQIAQELGLAESDVQAMTEQLRHGLAARLPPARLEGEVEFDEVYVVAGHKGNPAAVAKGAPGPPPEAEGRAGPRHAGEGQAAHLRPDPARGPGGAAHAGQRAADDDQAGHRGERRQGTLVHTDEYDVYARLDEWGYGHKTVCHARGEYARDEDGDGFCEVHVNTIEGFWSLLRSWLRPHRGISQEKLPLYLGFFQFVHNARRRGKALLGTLIAALVA